MDHLRLRLEILIERKQRVEDQIAEIAGDIGGRPNRVDAAQIGLRDEAQCRRPGLGPAVVGTRKTASAAAAAAVLNTRAKELIGSPVPAFVVAPTVCDRGSHCKGRAILFRGWRRTEEQ